MSSAHRFIYLAQPVDFRGEHDLVLGWISQLVKGVVVYSPSHAWHVGAQVQELNSSIQAGNLHILQQSAAMVAVMTGDPSVGVPMELLQKLQDEDPVVLLVDQQVAQRSWVLHHLAEQYSNLLTVPYLREDGRVTVPNGMNVHLPTLTDQLQLVMRAAVDRRLLTMLELSHYLRNNAEMRLGLIERLLSGEENNDD